MSTNKATLIIEFAGLLHKGQMEVMKHPARFKVVAAGRRWRKTSLGVVMALAKALENKRAGIIYPSYPMAQVGWRMAKSLARQIPNIKIREGERRISVIGGDMMQVKSADNPDSLRGPGYDCVIIDEAALVKEEAWTQALRPTLADRVGDALFMSTPKGRNWFWRLYEYARQHESDGWKAWQFPTASNPYIDADEIAAAKQLLAERVFLQEFLAEFIEDAGSVFRKVMDAATAERQEEAVKRILDEETEEVIQEAHQYVFGVDWGKYEDFTVLAVVDLTDSALVALDRFSQIDYSLQTGRLKALYERFRPNTIVAERNAMGEPLIEQLIRDGLPMQPFLTTNASKAQAIDALGLAFERGELRIIPDPVLISELQAYEAKRLPSGMLRYSAPGGMHDDCVMALALAWQAASAPEPHVMWL